MRSSTRSLNSGTIQLRTARSGAPFASFEGVQLNSSYDPQREADRFLERAGPSGVPSVCVIVGDTLPYLRNRLAERYPGTKIVSVYLHDELPELARGAFPGSINRHEWSPSSPVPLRDFLLKCLPLDDLQGLAALEWTPSVRAFPEMAASASLVIEQLVRESSGGWVTAAAFARSWAHNMFANFLSLEAWHLLEPHHLPVVVAASGPSLAKALPLLARRRSQFALLALPSSLEAISRAGLTPDLVVAVDAGYWAQLHLRGVGSKRSVPVAFPLTAARGVWRESVLPVVFSAGSEIERELYEKAGLAPSQIGSTGTVAAAAAELAAGWSDGPIVFAGLDLCFDGLNEHVRPHPFDALFEAAACRTAPLLTVLFERLARLGVSTGAGGRTPAMKTYAGWFAGLHSSASLYRLLPSHTELPQLRHLDAAGFDRLLAGLPHRAALSSPRAGTLPSRGERSAALRSLLDVWQHRAEHAAVRLRKEDTSKVLTEEPEAAAVASSLLPRGYVHLQGALRSLPAAEVSGEGRKLFEELLEEIQLLRRRYLR